MSLKNILVLHFRIDLYTKIRLVYQKGDTKPTLVKTNVGWISFFWDIYQIIYPPSFYPSNKDIFIFISQKIQIFDQISNFHIFQSNLNINVLGYLSFIYKQLDIKNSKKCQPIMLGANLFFGQKISKTQHPFLKREFFSQTFFFLKNIHKKIIN